ncbi:MAG: hypothetical protein BAA03_12880 [Caldibacillus debilis]|nr:MAG: hypothetical protein BAA03_12880 [Caldibacillus debilis]
MLAKGKKQRFEKLPTGKGKQARYGRKIFGRRPSRSQKFRTEKGNPRQEQNLQTAPILPAKNSNRKKGECPCQISGRRQPFGEEKRPFPRGNI